MNKELTYSSLEENLRRNKARIINNEISSLLLKHSNILDDYVTRRNRLEEHDYYQTDLLEPVPEGKDFPWEIELTGVKGELNPIKPGSNKGVDAMLGVISRRNVNGIHRLYNVNQVQAEINHLMWVKEQLLKSEGKENE
jgi:hypothetical protein